MKIKHPPELFELLEEKHAQYERIDFIENDPILIPHLFSKKEDIEIAGFLTATIAWGQRKSIMGNARKMVELMDGEPHDFILSHETSDLKRLAGFVHRTFNSDDLSYFMQALQEIYRKHGGLESAFSQGGDNSIQSRISAFKKLFFSLEHLPRTEKHVSDPMKKSTAKRLNMYLRWMVRPANRGVDFGIWSQITPAELMLPLDVHTAKVSRMLGLLSRKQNDWQAVEELSQELRSFDSTDPVKYDFALFGMGVNADLP